jgi:hypothetical protein
MLDLLKTEYIKMKNMYLQQQQPAVSCLIHVLATWNSTIQFTGQACKSSLTI